MRSPLESQRKDILGIDPETLHHELTRFFAERGQPAYRAAQVARWLFERDAVDFGAMSDLPKAERDALAELYVLEEPVTERLAVSSDRTAKHVWKLHDG